MAKQRQVHAEQINFIDWLNLKGVQAVSKMLDVNASTVRHWRLGNTYPRVEQMKKIKKLTKGQIDYVHIIDGAPFNITNI